MDAGLRWHKSMRSGSAGNCVEVAYLPRGGIALRDSKDRNAAPLFITGEESAAFIADAKEGKFDPPRHLGERGWRQPRGGISPSSACPFIPSRSPLRPAGLREDQRKCTIRHRHDRQDDDGPGSESERQRAGAVA